jgi:hypothetical protein
MFGRSDADINVEYANRPKQRRRMLHRLGNILHEPIRIRQWQCRDQRVVGFLAAALQSNVLLFGIDVLQRFFQVNALHRFRECLRRHSMPPVLG